MSLPIIRLSSPWIHPEINSSNRRAASDNDKKVDILFFSPWILETTVSPTFQIIREELSHCSRIVTKRVLDQYLTPSELDNYTDVIRYAKRYPVSLGILSIASFLKANGLKVAYHQLEADREKYGEQDDWLEQCVQKAMVNLQPDIIGVGGVTSEIPRIKHLCSLIRKFAPKTLIVAGGPHVTFRPQDLLEKGFADIVVHGEGEIPMLEIARHYFAGGSLEGIRGTSVLREGKIISQPAAATVELSDLPQPDYNLLSPEMKDNGIIYAMYTRACPYKCSYCSEGRLFGSRLRNYNTVEFVDTLEYIATELNWKFIHIADSTFGLPPKALNALLDELERRQSKFLFSINVRPDMHRYVSGETIRRMRELGFIEFLIGSESGSNDILKAMRRNHTTNDLLRTLKLLKDNRIPFVSTYWMVGLPFDTIDTLMETTKFIRELLENDLVFYASAKPFIPLPGTPIFDDPDYFGISIKSLDWNLYERYSLPLPHVHKNLTMQEIESVTLLLQSIQAAVFQKRAGECLFDDVGQLQQRIENSYEQAVYL